MKVVWNAPHVITLYQILTKEDNSALDLKMYIYSGTRASCYTKYTI